MKIIPIPQRRDDTLALSKSGDVLTINGSALDLTDLPEGATLPAEAVDCEWIAGPITREGGVLHIPVLMPHGPIPYPAPPEAAVVTHPEPITVATYGPIELPRLPDPEPDLDPPPMPDPENEDAPDA